MVVLCCGFTLKVDLRHLSAVPLNQAVFQGNDEVLLGQNQAQSSAGRVQRGLLLTVRTVNHQYHGKVAAYVHSLVLIPNKACELKLWVLVLVLDVSEAFMLIDLVVVALIVLLLLLILLLLLALDQLALKTLYHGEEVNTVGAKNSELSIVDRVEFDLLIVLGLARQLHLRLYGKLLVLLNVKNGDAEVGDPANHQQVATVPRESHIQHLDRCVGLETSHKLLARVPEDVHLRVKTVVCSCNEVLVVVCTCKAVTIALRPFCYLVTVEYLTICSPSCQWNCSK